jgi:hypothetical protein
MLSNVLDLYLNVTMNNHGKNTQVTKWLTEVSSILILCTTINIVVMSRNMLRIMNNYSEHPEMVKGMTE